jgi:hypothetical protein
VSDYTPTTEQIFDLVKFGALSVSEEIDADETVEMVKRWLAEHDREVARKAWKEGHTHCFHVENPNNPIKGNPYEEK